MDQKVHRPWQNRTMGNITRELPIDLSQGDFTDERGFFVRSAVGGTLKYCPVGNEDSEAITKEIEPSALFIDPVVCRKVFDLGESPDPEFYAGWGI